jgi:hypothetical protein
MKNVPPLCAVFQTKLYIHTGIEDASPSSAAGSGKAIRRFSRGFTFAGLKACMHDKIFEMMRLTVEMSNFPQILSGVRIILLAKINYEALLILTRSLQSLFLREFLSHRGPIQHETSRNAIHSAFCPFVLIGDIGFAKSS